MKQIHYSILYATSFLLFSLLSGQIYSAERDYRSHIAKATWETELKEQELCRIKQKIPNYGEAIFTRKSGHEMLFELTSKELFLNKTQIIIMAEPAPWRQNVVSFKIGSFELKKGHKPLIAKHPYASRMFQHIENGMMPTITYRDVTDRSILLALI